MSAPLHLVVGPARHGVNELALRLAEASGAPVARFRDAAGVTETLGTGWPARGTCLHLHLTDHLLGADPPAAALLVERLADGHRLTLTLHDLPQPSDGEHHAARAGAYRRMAAAADGLVVSSRHEAALLAALGCDEAPAVIPLPVDLLPLPELLPEPDREVGISGFVYPGKGHAQALAAMRELPDDVGLTAIGGISPGSEWLIDQLRAQAKAAGRRFTITGYIDDTRWISRLRSTAVPLAAHEHISASGSIGSWIAAGRRPLVVDSPYARELAARAPRAVTIYQPAELAARLRQALDEPRSTWRDEQVEIQGTAEVAAAYRRFWTRA